MTLTEACDRMNRRGAGPATGCEVVVAEDGDLLAYVTFANASPSPMLTAWFPAAIRRLEPEACKAAIRNASSWQIHSGFKVE